MDAAASVNQQNFYRNRYKGTRNRLPEFYNIDDVKTSDQLRTEIHGNVNNDIEATNRLWRKTQEPRLGIHNDLFAGNKRDFPVKPKSTRKVVKEHFANLKQSAKNIKIPSTNKLPWETDKSGKWYGNEHELLMAKINTYRTLLGLNLCKKAFDWKEYSVYEDSVQDVPEHKFYNKDLKYFNLINKADIHLSEDLRDGFKIGITNKLLDMELELKIQEDEKCFRDNLKKWILGTADPSTYANCFWMRENIKNAFNNKDSEEYDDIGEAVEEVKYAMRKGKLDLDFWKHTSTNVKQLYDLWMNETEKMKRNNPDITHGFINNEDTLPLRVDTFLKRLSKKIPTNEEEAFLWFKYIVLKKPINLDYLCHAETMEEPNNYGYTDGLLNPYINSETGAPPIPFPVAPPTTTAPGSVSTTPVGSPSGKIGSPPSSPSTDFSDESESDEDSSVELSLPPPSDVSALPPPPDVSAALPPPPVVKLQKPKVVIPSQQNIITVAQPKPVTKIVPYETQIKNANTFQDLLALYSTSLGPYLNTLTAAHQAVYKDELEQSWLDKVKVVGAQENYQNNPMYENILKKDYSGLNLQPLTNETNEVTEIINKNEEQSKEEVTEQLTENIFDQTLNANPFKSKKLPQIHNVLSDEDINNFIKLMINGSDKDTKLAAEVIEYKLNSLNLGEEDFKNILQEMQEYMADTLNKLDEDFSQANDYLDTIPDFSKKPLKLNNNTIAILPKINQTITPITNEAAKNLFQTPNKSTNQSAIPTPPPVTKINSPSKGGVPVLTTQDILKKGQNLKKAEQKKPIQVEKPGDKLLINQLSQLKKTVTVDKSAPAVNIPKTQSALPLQFNNNMVDAKKEAPAATQPIIEKIKEVEQDEFMDTNEKNDLLKNLKEQYATEKIQNWVQAEENKLINDLLGEITKIEYSTNADADGLSTAARMATKDLNTDLSLQDKIQEVFTKLGKIKDMGQKLEEAVAASPSVSPIKKDKNSDSEGEDFESFVEESDENIETIQDEKITVKEKASLVYESLQNNYGAALLNQLGIKASDIAELFENTHQSEDEIFTTLENKLKAYLDKSKKKKGISTKEVNNLVKEAKQVEYKQSKTNWMNAIKDADTIEDLANLKFRFTKDPPMGLGKDHPYIKDIEEAWNERSKVVSKSAKETSIKNQVLFSNAPKRGGKGTKKKS